MRTITIGDRKLSDLTELEFGNFLYYHGYSASPTYWGKPVFSEFDHFRESIHFTFTQIGTAGQEKVVTKNGILSPFNERAHFSYLERGDVKSHYFTVADIAYFLKLGFDFPIDRPKPALVTPEYKDCFPAQKLDYYPYNLNK